MYNPAILCYSTRGLECWARKLRAAELNSSRDRNLYCLQFK